MTCSFPPLVSNGHILPELCNGIGMITLNRPQALNALSLEMIRDLTALLLAWRDERSVKAVFVQGATAEGKGVAFCAGGDIRFFHHCALTGDTRLEDFFTEEYALNHLIHTYPKAYVAWMDGVVMGGGMGISQGGRLRIVTERTKMAMPETNIGLFPDVGGGYFLSRCPGRIGEYLALTGHVLGAGDAVGLGLADGFASASQRQSLRDAFLAAELDSDADCVRLVKDRLQPTPAATLDSYRPQIDGHFAQSDVAGIMASLAQDDAPWAAETLKAMRKRSPLMMSVTLEQIRRGRAMTLTQNLRMERDLVRNSFHLRPGAASETVEGIRALAIDKDHSPRWNPAHIGEVTAQMLQAFFDSPWPAHAHPLKDLR